MFALVTPVRAVLLAAVIFMLGFAVGAPAQTTWYVDDDAPLGGDGLSWDTAFKYLQDALYTAAGDPSVTEIRVAQGTYKPDQDEAGNVTPGDREATFQLISGLALRGGYAGITEPDPDERDIDLYETILSGDLAGDDGPDFENNEDNTLRVVTAYDVQETTFLAGFTIRGGNAEAVTGGRYGGGMHCSYGSPIVAACTFSENYAARSGGAMYNHYSSPAIIHTTFSGNCAPWGGAVHNYFSSPTLNLCTFTDNVGYISHGGAIRYVNSGGTLTNCSFARNSAGDDGGAIYSFFSPEKPDLSHCTFIENSAGGNGGGVAGAGTLVDCSFQDNSASGNGGGMSGGRALVNCAFTGNFAGGGGGGLYTGASLTGCTFVDNMCLRSGAGVRVHSAGTTVVDCTFADNLAVDNGGGLAAGSNAVELVRCTLHDNFAGDSGGAVYGHGNLTECTLDGNLANDAGGGLCIAADGDLTAANCAFTGNEADLGAGLACTDGCTLTLTDCTLSGNRARYGGGLYVNDGATATLTDCTFRGNYGDHGGGIYSSFAGPTVNNCVFHSNSSWSGGGMYNLDSSPRVANCIFGANCACEGWGGGMYNEGGNPLVVNCVFAGNQAYESGMSGEGGGIANVGTSSTIANCLFAGQDAYGSCSAVVCHYEQGTTLVSCTVSANTADYGGAVGILGENTSLTDCIIWDNWPDQIEGWWADVTYTCIEGGWNGEGNIDTDPLFVGGPSGTWTADGALDPETYQVVLTDENAAWGENELVGKLIDPVPHWWYALEFLIVANTATTITIWADSWTIYEGTSWITAGSTYQVRDFHLSIGSPCIDAGDNEAVPGDEFDLDEDGDTLEPTPFDLDGNPRFVDAPCTDDSGNADPDYPDLPIVDMGAYEYQPCTGDVDCDGDTDHADLGATLGAWDSQPGDPHWNPDADLDGDGHVGHGDLGILLADWGCGT